MAICTPGEPVMWSTLQALMLSIMEAGQVLGVEVEDLTQDSASVWSRDSTYPVPDLALTFKVRADKTVQEVHLSPGLGIFEPWDFPLPFLQLLEDQSSLVFVADQDDCWCKSMWFVVRSATGHTLRETAGSAFGCCQTIPVPAVGDTLDASQDWIPPGLIRGRTGLSPDSDDEGERDTEVRKCVLAAGGVMLRRKRNRLQAAQRELKGVLTWAIKPRHLQDLWDKLGEVVAASGGARSEKVRKASVDFPDAPRMGEASRVHLRDLLYTLRNEPGVDEMLDPGCIEMTEGQCDPKLPWLQQTCGGQDCEGSLKFYCNTLVILQMLVARLPEWLLPASGGTECSGGGKITDATKRTGALVQGRPGAKFSSISPVFTHYVPGDDLPPDVVILHESLQVDNCQSCLCRDDPFAGNCVAHVTSYYFRIFVIYLKDAWLNGAYEKWRLDALDTNQLYCQAYWKLNNSGLPPFNLEHTAPGQAESFFQEREPVRPHPVLVDGVRVSCRPYAGPASDDPPYSGPAYWTVKSAGELDPCGTGLRGSGAGSDGMAGDGLGSTGIDAAILMGWQTLAADVEMSDGFTEPDYALYGCPDSGYASPGASVVNGLLDVSPISFTSPGVSLSQYFTGISVQCLCPSGMENGADVSTGLLTGLTGGCSNDLFNHECD